MFKKNTKRERCTKSLQEVMENFFSRHRGKENFHIVQLWQNWAMVMGEELTPIALPLGTRDHILLIGVEDNMLMHELSFRIPEILERANAFMDEKYFTKIRLELLQGRKPLYPCKEPEKNKITINERPRPQNLGGLLEYFDPESTIGRAYRSYVRSFED